jgi:hypothetical protein
MATLKPIGDPITMRASDRRFGFEFADPIGEYRLDNGRTVRVIWLDIQLNRRNVIVWEVDSDDPATVQISENVPLGVKCSSETERLIAQFEAL